LLLDCHGVVTSGSTQVCMEMAQEETQYEDYCH